MTMLLFRDDAYLREAEADVVAIHDDGGIELDRTPFYPQGGGQPGDAGMLVGPEGRSVPVATTRYEADKRTVVHVPAGGAALLRPGDRVMARLDWPQRLGHMRVHTALHLLSVVLPYPVTGGAIGPREGRLDFDIPEAGLDKADVEKRLTALIDTDAEVRTQWITDAELQANPGLVKTMSVKPPMGSGQVRLVEIVGLDLQPCGGTHVRRTGEIGRVVISAIEKKGKQNRRVRLTLAD